MQQTWNSPDVTAVYKLRIEYVILPSVIFPSQQPHVVGCGETAIDPRSQSESHCWLDIWIQALSTLSPIPD